MSDKITLGSKVSVNTSIDEYGVRRFQDLCIGLSYETEVITNPRLFDNKLCVLVKGIGQYIPVQSLTPKY